jgi:hypothetical protein
MSQRDLDQPLGRCWYQGALTWLAQSLSGTQSADLAVDRIEAVLPGRSDAARRPVSSGIKGSWNGSGESPCRCAGDELGALANLLLHRGWRQRDRQQRGRQTDRLPVNTTLVCLWCEGETLSLSAVRTPRKKGMGCALEANRGRHLRVDDVDRRDRVSGMSPVPTHQRGGSQMPCRSALSRNGGATVGSTKMVGRKAAAVLR